MDVAVAKDLYRNLVFCGELLGAEAALVDKWADLLARLPKYRVNADGALAEWADPRFEDNYEHRHSSHLYPVMYEVDPDISADERLWEGDARGRPAEAGLAALSQPGRRGCFWPVPARPGGGSLGDGPGGRAGIAHAVVKVLATEFAQRRMSRTSCSIWTRAAACRR